MTLGEGRLWFQTGADGARLISLFMQVHLGVGKSENNLPSQGYELLQPGK